MPDGAAVQRFKVTFREQTLHRSEWDFEPRSGGIGWRIAGERSSTQLHNRPSLDVPDSFAKHFVRQRSRVSFAQKNESEDIRHRVSFFPFEVDMRNAPG